MTADLLDAAPIAAGSPAPASTSHRKHTGGRVAAVVAGFVVAGIVAGFVGVGVATVASGHHGRRSPGIDQGGYAPPFTVGSVAPGAPVVLGNPTDGSSEEAAGAATAAPTPSLAVTRFLDAEISRDFGTSYAQLSVADRTGFDSRDGWEVAHDQLPAYERYAISATKHDSVQVEVAMRPRVDEIVGVVPGAAHIVFAVVAEDGGFRVDLAETKFTPVYPDDKAASSVATTWVGAREACDPTRAGQFEGSLVGELDLAEHLCGVTGVPIGSTPARLNALDDPTFVLSAFGGEATEWARVVTVSGLAGITGPARIDVVLAPLGDTWVVIGAESAT